MLERRWKRGAAPSSIAAPRTRSLAEPVSDPSAEGDTSCACPEASHKIWGVGILYTDEFD